MKGKAFRKVNGPDLLVGPLILGMGPVENRSLIRLPPVISPINSISITSEFFGPHGAGAAVHLKPQWLR
jgi:hypothetical protein